MTYIPLISETVKQKIAKQYSEKFAIVFRGWILGCMHYVAGLASFPGNVNKGINTRLLAFGPMEDETSLDARDHVSFISFTLNLYKRSWNSVVCIIEDSWDVNINFGY